MKTSFMWITALASLLFLSSIAAQSEDTATKLLRELLDKKPDLEEEHKDKLDAATSEAGKLLETEEGKKIVNEAQEALANDPDTLLDLGRKLLDDPEALKKGEKLMDEKGVSSSQVEKARELLGNDAFLDMVKSAAQQAQEDGTIDKELEGLTGKGDDVPSIGSAAKPQEMEANGEVHIAVEDPVKQIIPKPNMGNANATRIEAEEAQFDADKNVVSFVGNVKLHHPQFDLSCDRLVVNLRDDNGKGALPGQMAAGGIENAVATGYVQIEKMAPDGKIQVAKSRYAMYNSLTEDVMLSNYPQLQSGSDIIRGLTEGTKIFLRADGTHKVDGKHEVIVPRAGAGGLELKPRS